MGTNCANGTATIPGYQGLKVGLALPMSSRSLDPFYFNNLLCKE